LPLDKISGQIGTHGRVSFMGIICDDECMTKINITL
jgi:hypothetical protein